MRRRVRAGIVARIVARIVACLALGTIGACSGEPRTPPAAATIVGGGATFPYPVYARWFSDYFGETGTRINYLSVGSSEGMNLLLADSVDFGATDIPLSDAQLHRDGHARLVQVPMVVGAVVIAYNLPGLDTIRLDAATLAGMFLGRVRTWNDAAVQRLNPGRTLPATPITVVHRDDISGTTIVLDRFLRGADPAWASAQATRDSVRWQVGEGEHGNEGISGHLKATIGAIGYVPLAYSQLFRLQTARVKNASGAFVAPTSASVSAAVPAVTSQLQLDARGVRSADPEPGTAYPIVTATWLAFPVDHVSAEKAEAVRRFVRWALARGASDAAALGYAAVPAPVRAHFDSVVSARH